MDRFANWRPFWVWVQIASSLCKWRHLVKHWSQYQHCLGKFVSSKAVAWYVYKGRRHQYRPWFRLSWKKCQQLLNALFLMNLSKVKSSSWQRATMLFSSKLNGFQDHDERVDSRGRRKLRNIVSKIIHNLTERSFLLKSLRDLDDCQPWQSCSVLMWKDHSQPTVKSVEQSLTAFPQATGSDAERQPLPRCLAWENRGKKAFPHRMHTAFSFCWYRTVVECRAMWTELPPAQEGMYGSESASPFLTKSPRFSLNEISRNREVKGHSDHATVSGANFLSDQGRPTYQERSQSLLSSHPHSLLCSTWKGLQQIGTKRNRCCIFQKDFWFGFWGLRNTS